MNVHKHMKARFGLAKTYAEDGAFHCAARILEDLAEDVKSHAIRCDRAVEAIINQRESGPAPIEKVG